MAFGQLVPRVFGLVRQGREGPGHIVNSKLLFQYILVPVGNGFPQVFAVLERGLEGLLSR